MSSESTSTGDVKVSNPLGWDGDLQQQLHEIRQQKVSNPLGWDGDLAKQALASALKLSFLIH